LAETIERQLVIARRPGLEADRAAIADIGERMGNGG
jgi:hypothetical protein